ncbi:MAG: carboxypeptidase-like regulatory domain-containing protein [Opitutaceae bacterium]|nr:carboxypeptidase-like regulatory domain-containing protein [Opitutaceae bacterium]
MTYPDTRHPRLSLFRRFQSATSLVFVFLALLFVSSLPAQEGGSGRITGVVTSKSSGNALQGAVVLIPSLNRSALTDSTGSFSLRDLPAGALEVVVSYSGFTESSQRVVAESGKNVELSIQLASAEVVQLEAFTVESVKEGQALGGDRAAQCGEHQERDRARRVGRAADPERGRAGDAPARHHVHDR